MVEDKIQIKRVTLSQRMNRLKEQESRIKTMERKTRTRRLVELGGLIAKAKLDHLGSNELYGALLDIADRAKDGSTLKAWEEKGGRAFVKEVKQNGEPVGVKFTAKPDLEARHVLREHGLKWNSLRHEWEGIGDYLILKPLVETI